MITYALSNKAVLRRPLEPGAYTSLAFSKRIIDLDFDQSLGRTGDCYDNAAVESFFATLKRELAWIHATKTWATRAALPTALFDYIEGFYNPERIQQRLDYRNPLRFEEAVVAYKPVSTRPGQVQGDDSRRTAISLWTALASSP
jgi:transposase InsO family protein